MVALLEEISGFVFASMAIVAFLLWPIKGKEAVLMFYFPQKGATNRTGTIRATLSVVKYIFYEKRGKLSFRKSLLLSNFFLVAFFAHGLAIGRSLGGSELAQIIVSWTVMNYVGDIFSIIISAKILSLGLKFEGGFGSAAVLVTDFMISSCLFFFLLYVTYLVNVTIFGLNVSFHSHLDSIAVAISSSPLRDIQSSFLFFSIVSTLISSVVSAVVVLAAGYRVLALAVGHDEDVRISEVQAQFVFFCSFVCLVFSIFLVTIAEVLRRFGL